MQTTTPQEEALLRLFRCLEPANQHEILAGMVRTLAEPQEPTEILETIEEVPDDVLLGLWPGNWNGNSYVNLYYLGDPAEWLEESLEEPAVDTLFGRAWDDERTATSFAKSYYEDIKGQYPFPSALAEDDEPVDDMALFTEDFRDFLRRWRENVLGTLEERKARGA